MGQEMRFDKSPLYDEDFVSCSCGFLQLFGFRWRISKAIPGSYARLHTSDRETDISEDTACLSSKEKDQVAKQNSYRRNIKAWIKRRINKRQNKKQKRYSDTAELSRTYSIHRSKFNQTGDSLKELGRTLLDGLLHRIPYGQKVPEGMIKEKLCRSLSADYDSYTKRGKKSSTSLNANQDNKFRRIYSSPASVTEKKFYDTTNGKREEETLLDGYHDKDAKCDILELAQESKADASVCENRNGIDEEIFLTGEHTENTICELFKSKEDGIHSDATCNLESDKKEENCEKTENGSTPSEIRDVGPMESTILQEDIGEKDLCIDPKDLESLTNLLKQLGIDMSLGDDDDDETTQIKTKEDEETPILDSEVGLEEFKRAWDQINKVEFSKFDCNILPQDLILVLDLIDQAYTEAYNCSSCFVWFSHDASKLSKKMIENHVLKEVQERATWYLKAHEECSDEDDDLVAWDLERYDEWLNHRADFENIVVELEKLVLDDLIEGFVVEDSNVGKVC